MVIDKLLNNCNKLVISTPYGDSFKNDPQHIITNIVEESFSMYEVLHSLRWKKAPKQEASYFMVMLKGKK